MRYFIVIFFLLKITFCYANNIKSIPVGDAPFALSLSKDGNFVYVVNLFPEGVNNSNLKIINLQTNKIEMEKHIGTRLVAIKISGNKLLIINEDNDYLFTIDLENNFKERKIHVGSRPSNVIGINNNFAVVTNGTSGDLSFVDLKNYKLIEPNIKVGNDPRDVIIHPYGRWLYVALGGENAVGVIDVNTKKLIKKVKVGKNPVSLSITPDGKYLLVANLTNNSITMLDITDGSNPKIRLTNDGLYQLLVGMQPSKITITPDGKEAYIANMGSNWITVVDIPNYSIKGVIQTSYPSSSVEISEDGKNLFVLEFKNNANLLIFDINNLKLKKMGKIDIPGEPNIDIFLDADKSLDCPGFYIVTSQLSEGAESGYWGMEIKLTKGNRLFEGGFNLGGGFGPNGEFPGYIAFNIANPQNEPQKVNMKIKSYPILDKTKCPKISVELFNSKREIIDEKTGEKNVELDKILNPGFYIVEVRSLDNEDSGFFQIDLSSHYVDRKGGGLQGGIVVGGYLQEKLIGYGAFCISTAQDVKIKTQGRMSFGEVGAEAIDLTILDRNGKIIRKVSNFINTKNLYQPPQLPEDISNISANIYVDDDAAFGGNGSKEKPYRSITEAIQNAKSGDIIYVFPGIYSPSTTGEKIPIGSIGINKKAIPSNVTIIGAGAEKTIIDAENQCGENCNAVVIQSSNVRIAGFTIRKAKDFGLYVYNAEGIVIDHNLFISNGRNGLGTTNSRGLIIKNNVFMANREHGAVIAGATKGTPYYILKNYPDSFGAVFINNISINNRVDGILVSQGGEVYVDNNTLINNGGMGIEFNNRKEGQNYPPLNGWVRNNTLISNGGVQFAFAGEGILFTEGANAMEISGNFLQYNRPFGIAIYLDATAQLIKNNKILDTKGSGLAIQKNSYAKKIENNIISNSNLCGIFIENNSRVEDIINNIITNSGMCTSCSFSKAGLSVLLNSEINNVKNNTFNFNLLGMEVDDNSIIKNVENCFFNNNKSNGILLTDGARIIHFNNNTIQNNRNHGLMIGRNTKINIYNSKFINNNQTGISGFENAEIYIENSFIEENKGDIGINIWKNSTATLIGNKIINNGKIGLQAVNFGTKIYLSGNFISNHKYGLNSQDNAEIYCNEKNYFENNAILSIGDNIFNCK